MHVDTINSRLDSAQFAPLQTGLHAALAVKRIIEYAIAVVFEVRARDLCSATRGTAETAFARQVARKSVV